MIHPHWWPRGLDPTVPRDVRLVIGHMELRMSHASAALKEAESAAEWIGYVATNVTHGEFHWAAVGHRKVAKHLEEAEHCIYWAIDEHEETP